MKVVYKLFHDLITAADVKGQENGCDFREHP